MGYLDYVGLQYLWGNLKEKFAPKSHNHDDRYYTESEMDSKLSGKADNTRAGANDLINKLDSETAAPVDDDLIVTQWANHTTAANKNQYVRRPMSSIWNYIKSKADSVYQPKGSYAASSHTHNYAGAASPGGSATSAIKLDTATAGSATCPIYFSDGKPVACTYTLGKSVPSNAVFTDTKYENMKGATSSMAGSSGLVPAPRLGELDKFLKSDGTWGIPKQTKIQICRW